MSLCLFVLLPAVGCQGAKSEPAGRWVEKGCRLGQDSGALEPTSGSRRNPRLYLNEEAAGFGRQVGVPEGQRAMKQEAITSKRFKFEKGHLYGAWLLELWAYSCG